MVDAVTCVESVLCEEEREESLGRLWKDECNFEDGCEVVGVEDGGGVTGEAVEVGFEANEMEPDTVVSDVGAYTNVLADADEKDVPVS
jgi:hypothetical protein